MHVVRPCLVGQMGSTTYYETTMTGRELASSVRPGTDSDEWATKSIDEQMHRSFDLRRIRETIVPYIAHHPDRFFGSLIILAPSGSLSFEPLANLVPEQLPAAYHRSIQRMGFLAIPKHDLVALDGQHRLLAYREVVAGGSRLGEFAGESLDDELAVLLIEFESLAKTRRIFNKVNRHARPTSRSDNLLTSEDDGAAIVARRLLDPELSGPLGARWVQGERTELVNWRSNTLGQNSRHLTTLSAVYETVQEVCRHHGIESIVDRTSTLAPQEPTLVEAFDLTASWWREILKLGTFRRVLGEPGLVVRIRNDRTDPGNLLLRPAAQVAMVRGVVRALEVDPSLSLASAISNVGDLSWDATSESIWNGSLLQPDGRVSARSDSMSLAAELLAYLLVGDLFDVDRRDKLQQSWNEARGNRVGGLPELQPPPM